MAANPTQHRAGTPPTANQLAVAAVETPMPSHRNWYAIYSNTVCECKCVLIMISLNREVCGSNRKYSVLVLSGGGRHATQKTAREPRCRTTWKETSGDSRCYKGRRGFSRSVAGQVGKCAGGAFFPHHAHSVPRRQVQPHRHREIVRRRAFDGQYRPAKYPPCR